MLATGMPFLLLFRHPALGPLERGRLERSFKAAFALSTGTTLEGFESEYCYAVEWENELPDMDKLKWLLAETWEPEKLSFESQIANVATLGNKHTEHSYLVEYGPRLSFSTAWATNAAQICRAAGLNSITRIERSRRLLLYTSAPITDEKHRECLSQLHNALHDRMTEMVYDKPFPELVAKAFEHYVPSDWSVVDVLGLGKAALEKINKDLGLAFDDFDLEYYTALFTNELKRNPTSVELFDLSQSNSEHSRHWFFRGKLVIENVAMPYTLWDLVKLTLNAHKTNSVLALCDNASAIRGREITTFVPSKPGFSSVLLPHTADYDITFTAETHNFPTGIAPFPGAETGTGGRIRDTQAAGRGSLPLAGTTGYSVGQLHIPGYYLPWEDHTYSYPTNMAKPLQIIIEASSGASDYANKFGEPLIVGFTRSFGQTMSSHSPHHHPERREYIKPIMFTGGMGQMDHLHLEKHKPLKNMKIIKIGGPAYRIGLGGGAASSMVQGDNKEDLDYNAVQRGDAEMEQKLNRVVRACVELGAQNPIVSIHDQGAGGNANVLKELIEPEGGIINVRDIPCGDFTLSALEIWSAEYQENDALLIHEHSVELFKNICERESCTWAIVGVVTGDGKAVLYDSRNGKNAVDLPLSAVLGKMPQKTFTSHSFKSMGSKLHLPKSSTLNTLLERILRNLSVGSKRFLTTKIDRSVTGLVAQQPCVGPLHIPLADYGATVQSYFEHHGMATSIGEQPIIGLLNPEAMARMTVGESLTNIVFAATQHGIDHIKASGNWMWPAKLDGEADAIYRACDAMSKVMMKLGVSIDGGKDSLSMAAKSGQKNEAGKEEIVKTPGTLVVSLYAPVDDVRRMVNPAIRRPGESQLVFVDLAQGKQRLGGSILAQSFSQLGNTAPDLDAPDVFAHAWNTVRQLILDGKILAGHDRSDGGLITTLLEMAFAGDCGFDLHGPPAYCNLNLPYNKFLTKPWLNEELGLVLEVLNQDVQHVLKAFDFMAAHVHVLGVTTVAKHVSISYINNDYSESLLDEAMSHLRDIWESTSFELEKLQANHLCVRQEQLGLHARKAPAYQLTFQPSQLSISELKELTNKPKVAIIREEGSNGDREMGAAFFLAGFEVWDVNMKDLLSGAATLDAFQGVAFVGGFSYADVMDSAKGWAGTIRYNAKLLEQFDTFINKRKDTFSLGICNGCQLMALLGYVPFPERKLSPTTQPRFIHNTSGRFESRFTTVSIAKSPAIMFKDMEGSTLGIWLSHGEGRAHFPADQIMQDVIDNHLAPLRYADDDGHPTEFYPFNPNGSPHGIAALCSLDGRHLAMMPHAERTAFTHNWAWMPEEWRQSGHPCTTSSPWLKMFQNAYAWSTQQTKH